MLAITRHLGESVLIGENITVTIVEIRGHRVRLGIEAPRNITIIRDEFTKDPNAIRDFKARMEAK